MLPPICNYKNAPYTLSNSNIIFKFPVLHLIQGSWISIILTRDWVIISPTGLELLTTAARYRCIESQVITNYSLTLVIIAISLVAFLRTSGELHHISIEPINAHACRNLSVTLPCVIWTIILAFWHPTVCDFARHPHGSSNFTRLCIRTKYIKHF